MAYLGAAATRPSCVLPGCQRISLSRSSLRGEPTRIVVVDPSQRIEPRLRTNLSAENIEAKVRQSANESSVSITASQEEQLKRGAEQMASGFLFVDHDTTGKTEEEIRRELNAMAARDEIDGYLLVPADLSERSARFEFRSRKAGDFITNDTLRDALNAAVRSERLAAANIDESLLKDLSQNVQLQTRSITESGEEKDSEMLFFASLVIGMMIYITLTIYGQVIMGAVVEEKETRIAEILFSSATPFELMFGKLVGVALAGLTQLSIWVGSIVALMAFIATQSNGAELLASLPDVTPLMLVYFFIFFKKNI